MIEIVDFTRAQIPVARALAAENYLAARRAVPALPDCATVALEGYAENGMGVAALQNGELVGFLCATGAFNNAFGSTDVAGVFSEAGANGAREGNAGVYPLMYAAAADKWLKAGAVSHGICLYDNQRAELYEFFKLGFGIRCRDAIRRLDKVNARPTEGYELVRLDKKDFIKLLPLDNGLTEHMTLSPCFMKRAASTAEELVEELEAADSVVFAALYKGEPVSFLRAEVDGENFVKEAPGYLHIKGAYCRPEHRRRGLSAALLSLMMDYAAQAGYTRLGVDYESINPTAEGFWPRYFTPYTASVVRRIDERVLSKYK